MSFPPTPSLADAAVAGLAGRRASRRGWSATAWSRPLAFAAMLTLLIAGAVAALTLVLPGLRIYPVASLPPVPSAAVELGAGYGLGRAVAASEMRGLAWPAVLGEPDEVRVSPNGAVVSLVYEPDETLPAMGGTGIGLVLQAIDGALERELIEKLVVEVGATVEPVEVDGASGFWIDGPPHLVRYIDPSGDQRTERTRLVGRTLVWELDGVLYRLEAELDRAAAIRIAESLGR